MRRPIFVLIMFALLPWLSTPGLLHAAGQDKQAAGAIRKTPITDLPGYVGSEICATCHADIATKFSANPHAKLALMHNGAGATCESCHGPGQAHVEGGGDATKIFRFEKASAQKVDATCLGCHASAHPNFKRSPHGEAGVSCTSCHSVHGLAVAASATDPAPANASVRKQPWLSNRMFETLKPDANAAAGPPPSPTASVHIPGQNPNLLKAAQPQLCFQCHSEVKATFAMPFHHPVTEGAVSCSDCHDPHGTFQKNNLKSTGDQNYICTKCHVETRGPFVYEHAPVKAEGCMSCHTPHGSQNARLLNMPSINTLCNQCHSPVAAGAFHSVNAGSSAQTPCTNCHTLIHGSNLNQAFLK